MASTDMSKRLYFFFLHQIEKNKQKIYQITCPLTTLVLAINKMNDLEFVVVVVGLVLFGAFAFTKAVTATDLTLRINVCSTNQM